ncbi:MAG: ATP-binding protein [Bacteroidota bacterium]
MLKPIFHLILAYCLCLCSPVLSQDYIHSTYEITAADGLLSNRVFFVYQDEDGFIWLRTLDGVARYDGHTFKWFTKSNTRLRGVPRASQMVEDAEGYFWFTDGNHVDLMHRKTFEVLSLAEKFPDGVPFKPPIGQFWQGLDGGVYMRQISTEEYYYYHPTSGFKHLPHLKGVGSVHAKKDGLWAHTEGQGWRKYALDNNELLKSFALDHQCYLIHNYREEEDWFAYFNDISREVVIIKVLEEQTEEIMRISSPEGHPYTRPYVFYDPNHKQLVLNMKYADHSFSLIDLATKSIIPVPEADEDRNSTFLPTMAIDNNGIYWQRSLKGLRLLKLSEPVFTPYASGIAARGLWANDQYLFAQNSYVELNQPQELNSISEVEPIQSTFAQNKEELWLGGGQGIFEIDVTDLSVKDHIPMTENNAVWSILRDRKQNWWAGLWNNGIALKTQGDSILRPYTHFNGHTELATSRVMHLLEDGNYIWAVTNSGLYNLHKNEGVQRRYWSSAEAPYRLPLDDVHHLHKDEDGVYWVATNADGLLRFELDDQLGIKNFRQYTTDDKLSSNVLYAIIEDQQDRLWISSLNGISCFDKKTENIQVFLEEDGLAKLEFNRISYFQDKKGKIYFGSIDGVVGFDPHQVIKFESYNNPVYTSEFSLYEGQSEQIVDRNPNSISSIVLQPNDRFFRLNVSMLDYFDADRQRFAYKIEGLFEDYQKIQGNVIEISGLPYGKYTLRVQGRSSDNRTSTQELVLPLVVLAPIYYRWWFIALILLLTIITITQIYYWRVRQLEERRRELQVLVSERTAKIAQQAEELQALDEIKSRFFANISHELRTPLTLLLAPIDQLLEANNQSTRAHTFLQLMRQNGKKLLKRINELLDLSRLDANRLKIEQQPTVLFPFFRTILSSFESAAQLKGIQLLFTFQLDDKIQVMLDADKVEKIVSNFLSNALKFTPEGGDINCQIKRDHKKLIISVADTGPGIAPEDLSKIFERFYQSERTKQHEGTGIGLALCRELAKALGGSVWAISKPIGATAPSGSTFFLALPYVESSTDITQETPSVVSDDTIEEVALPSKVYTSFRPRVLVVEDNPDLQQYIRMILQEKYRIETAGNGQEALEWLTQQPTPALIVSDIMMPVMNGLELLQKLKQDDKLRHIPTIMLTAQQRMDVKLEALRIGVDDYLTKPFQAAELSARVGNLIKNSTNRVRPEQAQEGAPLVPVMEVIDLEWLQTLEEIISSNLTTRDYKLTSAAEELHISYRRLQQKLKAITGLSPKQYQRSIRLDKAREILKSGEVQTVQEAMSQIGFENHYHFNKLYQEAFGIKPIQELK